MRISITVEVDFEGKDINQDMASLLKHWAYLGVMEKWGIAFAGNIVSGGSLPLEGFAPTQKSTTYIELRDV